MAIQPPQRFQLDDLTHVEREARTIYAPGATPGDVLVVQSDHSLVAAPGGGSQPVSASYSGHSVTIANGASGQLTFDTLETATPLLDLTDPANPLVLASGEYAITAVFCSGDPLTAGGHALAVLQAVAADADKGGEARTSSTHPEGCTGVTIAAALLDAGDALAFYVYNYDGAASRDYYLGSFLIVKLA